MARRSEALDALARLTSEQRAELIRGLSPEMAQRLLYSWEVWARPEQLWRPGPETYTVYLAGRGWGKTRSGAEAVRYVAERPELCGGRILIAGRTAADIRETMVDGPSGILAVSPPDNMPEYQPSRARLVWPKTGVVGQLISADVPRAFRGPQFGFAWLDELAHWPDPESFEMIQFGLRLGAKPRCIVTTTPIGTQQIIELVYEVDDTGQPVPGEGLDGFKVAPDVRVVEGYTGENAANLSPDFVSKITSKYDGTTLGAQELYGKILMGLPGAIFSANWWRRCEPADVPELRKVMVIIDPAVSAGEGSAETGIVVAGLSDDGRVYLLDNASGAMSPEAWAARVVEKAGEYNADSIAVEDNQGGDLLEHVLTETMGHAARRFKIERLRATKSKPHRFGMASGTWEQGRVYHVGSPRKWVQMEHQLLSMTQDAPKKGARLDQADAAVWGVLALSGARTDASRSRALGDRAAWEQIRSRLAARRR